ncbi:MAG: heme biosynthesis protein HemY [Alphaproteobacteria bacterium]|nr:heme biosynthesis protein HemY [Alphaproteobacteria bacterium]
MTRVVLLALLIVVVALAAAWLGRHPGTVAVEWLGWRADTSVAMLAFAVALVTVLGALGYRFWRFLRHLPASIVEALRLRRRRRGYEALSSGMIAAAAGDAGEAGRQARRADALLRDVSATRLLRAEAARLSGDKATARRTYEEMTEAPETALIGLRGLLDQAEAAGDKAEALRLAEKAHRHHPKARGVAERLFQLQADTGQWAAADRTMAEAMRDRLFPASDARPWRAAVLVERSRLAEKDGEIEMALAFARDAQQLDADLVPAAVQHARLLGRQGKARRAQRLLEKIWPQHPHPEIAAAYGALFDGEGPLQRVKRYQRLLSFRPDHPEGHIALAEAALEAELWGEARAHLGQAADRQLTPRICRMLADLEEAEHANIAESRKWLERVAAAEPDSAWVCDSCGAVSAAWSARCAACGAFDSIGWRPPPRSAAVPARAAAASLPGPAQARQAG